MKLKLIARIRLARILHVSGSNIPLLGRLSKPMAECQCRNCGTHYVGNYCPRCGQSSKTRRLTFMNMLEDGISVITNLDNGFLRTCFELFWRPGHMMRDYILGKRKGYMKPVSLLFCLGTIYYVVVWLFAKENLIVLEQLNNDKIEINGVERFAPYLDTLKELIIQIYNNPAIMQLCMILPMIPAAWLTFRKTAYGKAFNFMEHLHIQLLIACQLLLFTFIVSIVHWFSFGHLEYMTPNLLPNFLLLVWDFMQLFRLSFKSAFWHTVLCVVLEIVILSVLLVPVGALAYYLFEYSK